MLSNPAPVRAARSRPLDIGSALRGVLAVNRPLGLVALSMLVVLAFTLGGLVLDPRVITGVPAWLKPAKFAFSIAVYSFTLLWLLSFVQGHRRLVGAAATLTALGFFVEMIAIVGQAARGTTSHFNVATPLDELLWGLMAAFIVVVWTMNLLVAGLLLRQRLPDPAVAWALRLGLLVTFVGMGVGFLMPGETELQRAARAGGPTLVEGAHSVGVPDGGPGLPIVNWSTEGGDLRAPHFVGLHALQVLPLIGWLLTRRRGGRLGHGHRVALVWTTALAYLGLVLLLTWQALRGQSVIAPDGLTLGALAALAGATGVAAAVTVAHAPARRGIG